MRFSRLVRRSALGVAVIAVGLASTGEAYADDRACMAAASEGQELRDGGRLIDARQQFKACAQSECPAPIPSYCADWLSDVGRKIPTLAIRVVDENGTDVADAGILLDERDVALDGRAVEVDPGRHRLRISREGMKTFELEVVAAQGEKDRVVVARLAPVAPPAPPPPPVVAPKAAPPFIRRVPFGSWAAWGIGAAGLLSFSIFGLKARLDYDGYESTCGSHCTVANRDSVARSVATADVSLVVGLVGAGVGTLLFLMQPHGATGARATASGAP